MNKRRDPLQVSPVFKKKLKDLQLKIRLNGSDRSLRDLTEDIARDILYNEIEKKILKGTNKMNFDIRVKFDGGLE